MAENTKIEWARRVERDARHMPGIDEKTPQNAECEKCGHVWIVAWIPMNVMRFIAVIKGAHCPRCGVGSKDLFIHEARKQEEPE